MRKPAFYYRLTAYGKKIYDHNDKPLSERFIKLMNQLRPSKDADECMFYNDEEIEFLAKENLAIFGELHDAEVWWYMTND